MNSIENIKIYTFYYQTGSSISLENYYIPIWAGKNNMPNVPGFIGDDTNENISHKNKYYSELTGLFWVWKNTKSDIIGSCHYRRYFTIVTEPISYRIKRLLYFLLGLWRKRFGLIYTQDLNFWKPNILNKDQINHLLKDYEAILPVRRKLKYSVETHYKRYHNFEDLILIEQILTELYPDYVNSYKKVLADKRIFANNMFVLKWESFDQLMEWLFTILFKFEEIADLNNYQGYQERIFGFLSERLITLWIIHNNIKYKELPLIYFKKLKPNRNA